MHTEFLLWKPGIIKNADKNKMEITSNLPAKPNLRAAFGLTVIFFLTGLAGVFNHEPWLDEMHHWLLAKESQSLIELYSNMRQEGHPPLWNVILFIITRFTIDPIWMQLVHLLFGTLGMFVLLCRGPFSIWFKTGLVFSYYFLYEYLVLSRNYAPGILLLWLICSLLTGKKNTFILVSLLAGLLANIHLFCLFISIPIMLVIWLVHFKKESRFVLFTGSALFILLMAISIWFIIPPDNHFLIRYNQDGIFSLNRLEKGASLFFKTFFLFPDFLKINCWNSNLLSDKFRLLTVIPALISFVIPYLIFARHKIPLFMFYLSALLIGGFIYISPLHVGVRYFGMIYLAFIAALWLQKIFNDDYKIVYSAWFSLHLNKLKRYLVIPFFILLFATQVLSSVILYIQDYKRPFSQAKQTSKFLVESGFVNKNLAVTNPSAISSLRGFFPLHFFSLEADNYPKFCPWIVFPFQFSESQVMEKMNILINSSDTDWILVSNHYLDFSTADLQSLLKLSGVPLRISLIKSFTGSLVGSENYYIYTFSRH